MELSISQLAAQTGLTSRTLRHYDAIGLLPASRVGANGYRYYEPPALFRLQRIILLRDLGLGLDQIASILNRPVPPIEALRAHATSLKQEQKRISRQLVAIEKTIEALREGKDIMATEMFDGFDQKAYQEEVTRRWGKDAYDAGVAWWKKLDPEGKPAWIREAATLNRDWIAAFESGTSPESPEAQVLATRHTEWLASMPGTPAYKARRSGDTGGSSTASYLRGLGQLYVTDPRFAVNYGGAEGAGFVRDALTVYADRIL